MHKYLEREVNEAQLQLNTSTNDAESFFLPASFLRNTRRRRSTETEELHNQIRHFFVAVAALAAATEFILGGPINGAACNALSIFNLCDSREDLERELHQMTKQQTI